VEEAAEAGAGELDADQVFAGAGCCAADVDDLALSGEIGLFASAGRLRERNIYFQVRTYRYVETRNESSAAAAEIFAGRFLDEGDTAGIAAANSERQADSDAALGARALRGCGCRCSCLDHANPQVLTVCQRVNRSAADLAARSNRTPQLR
jgi:hypothetical protein